MKALISSSNHGQWKTEKKKCGCWGRGFWAPLFLVHGWENKLSPVLLTSSNSSRLAKGSRGNSKSFQFSVLHFSLFHLFGSSVSQ